LVYGLRKRGLAVKRNFYEVREAEAFNKLNFRGFQKVGDILERNESELTKEDNAETLPSLFPDGV
jgi:hypothetical protein